MKITKTQTGMYHIVIDRESEFHGYASDINTVKKNWLDCLSRAFDAELDGIITKGIKIEN